GSINIYNNNKLISENISISASSDEDKFVASPAVKIRLQEGVNKIKIYFKKGGFGFNPNCS
ncbi:MAG: hypothetical protein ACREOZ_03150, partial [Gloeomargaritales cyanobacterium]